MRHKLTHVLLLFTSVALTRLCPAQDWQSNGQGYTPMPPVSPTSPGNLNRSAVPGPPTQPAAVSRPSSWPGGGPAKSSPWPRQAPSNETLPAGEIQPCIGSRIIARVGSEAILESEVAGAVNEMIEMNKARIRPDELDKVREMLIQKPLRERIQTKLICQDAKGTIPAEGLANFEKKLAEVFETDELPKLMKKAEVATHRELDQKLRALGTSLERKRRAFIESTLAREWVHQQVKPNEETTYDQMVAYYRDHLKEFTTTARAEWEELTVRYSKHPTKAAAFDAIARMGNQVLAGAPLAQVAKAGSDGHTASDGGLWPWTSKGALASQKIDAALFSLPVGQLSQIIDGPNGYHIIRVTRREDQQVRPFLEAQVNIKKKIVQQRSRKQFREYMEKLTQRTPVWTIFDSDPSNPQLANPPRQQPVRR